MQESIPKQQYDQSNAQMTKTALFLYHRRFSKRKMLIKNVAQMAQNHKKKENHKPKIGITLLLHSKC